MAFFEQVGKLLTDAGQSVTQQTKNLANVTQLNSAVSDKEKEVSQLFLAIGQAYYERHKNDNAAEELEKISEINALYAEISANREKINQIKGVVKCENCGADVPLNAAFCSACGTKVNHTEAAKENAENVRFCPACHATVEKDNLFCRHCGAKIESTNK